MSCADGRCRLSASMLGMRARRLDPAVGARESLRRGRTREMTCKEARERACAQSPFFRLRLSLRLENDARAARGFWLSACGRVQVMCPACWCGAMTAGPDVVRGSGPYQSPGLDTLENRALPINRSTASHHALITLAFRLCGA